MNILVTGGAGFIGSHLVDKLIQKNHRVVILDNLEKQVHHGKKPLHINKQALFIQGNITNIREVDEALQGIDIVFHLAAQVGVGQSMYEIGKYTKVNDLGSAILLDLIVNKHKDHIKKVIVAASMSEYGEGLYQCKKCGDIKPQLRDETSLKQKRWEPICPSCSLPLTPQPTHENVFLTPHSVYALSKRNQEDLFLTVGKTYNIPTVVLRFFNTYGPRQSLSNPYTGIVAIFISRLKAKKSPIIFEDGLQSRDLVSVHDVVSANIEVMENKKADYEIFNIGSGKAITIQDLAFQVIKIFGSDLTPIISQTFRKGDIRHCFADISEINRIIGWKPRIQLKDGLHELITWSYGKKSNDMLEKALDMLHKKGII